MSHRLTLHLRAGLELSPPQDRREHPGSPCKLTASPQRDGRHQRGQRRGVKRMEGQTNETKLEHGEKLKRLSIEVIEEMISGLTVLR
jgi:hypothetical protein